MVEDLSQSVQRACNMLVIDGVVNASNSARVIGVLTNAITLLSETQMCSGAILASGIEVCCGGVLALGVLVLFALSCAIAAVRVPHTSRSVCSACPARPSRSALAE